MNWIAMTLFFFVLEAALWTAPQEFWTQENTLTTVGIGVGAVILYVIIMKGKKIVISGKNGDESINVQIYGILLGLVASAGIAAGVLNLTFKNLPVTQDLCRVVWRQVIDTHLPVLQEKISDIGINLRSDDIDEDDEYDEYDDIDDDQEYEDILLLEH